MNLSGKKQASGRLFVQSSRGILRFGPGLAFLFFIAMFPVLRQIKYTGRLHHIETILFNR